jgi:hypothetical protein
MRRRIDVVRAVLLCVAVVSLQGAVPAGAQTPPLTFFKNYFVTGDYVVGGTSLWQKGVNGRATEEIVISGVPVRDDVDILAAFLYLQTAESVQWSGIDHAKFGPGPKPQAGTAFNGYDFGPGAQSFAKALNWDLATPPCWSVNIPGGRRMVTYRADVLRFLPIAESGKTQANGTFTVEVPDIGSGSGDVDEGGSEDGSGTGPRAIGASLVIVYRDATLPLRAIVIYDGGRTKSAFGTFDQTIAGFYEASTPAARMTHIVGDGRPYLGEKVEFRDPATSWETIATNPFVSADGAKWDNWTVQGLPLTPGAASATVRVSPNSLFSDCLTFSAMIFSTDVRDSDGDGLLDIWESSTTTLYDPNGQPLPNLAAMGADPSKRDLFVEIGYMKTDSDTDYGGVIKPAHSHLPSPAALKLVGEAFAAAPPDPRVIGGTPGINVHFDVGPGYDPGNEAYPYIVRDGARGGEAIDESSTLCSRGATAPVWECQFGPQPVAGASTLTSGYPGTVGWKTGFRFLRDEVLSGPPPPAPGEEDPCEAPGNTCVRRFDRNRKDIFRYALFAHAVGLPRSEQPCLDTAGQPVPVNDTAGGLCVASPTDPRTDNPDFHVPRTISGIGDFRGGDFMVTLGAFPDVDGRPVGTPFFQASTLMHEVGHNLGRRHGGEAFEPNCKPTYFSVMNYLYQLRGLLDDDGTPHLDFSGQVGPSLDETNLSDGLSGLPYRIGWYAPLVGSYLEGRGTAAKVHCDGSPLDEIELAEWKAGRGTVRIDARTKAGPVDWKADNDLVDASFALDINFSGATTLVEPPGAPQILAGSDDWSNLSLTQVGGRRNVGALFIDLDGLPTLGPFSLDVGRGDAGRGDAGRGDAGRGDAGRGDAGRGDAGRGDAGRGDAGRGDAGRGDAGRGDAGRGDAGGGDLFDGDPNNPGGELDFETAVDLAKAPPNEFKACVIGGTGPDACTDQSTPLHRVRLDWKAPTVGGVFSYVAYRADGETLDPGEAWTPVPGPVEVPCPVSPESSRCYSAIDDAQLVDGAAYTYFAIAVYEDGIQSDPSNLVTITAVNTPPVATNDSYTVDYGAVLNVAAPGVLINDSDPEGRPLTAVVVTGPANGSLALDPNGSFTYTPNFGFTGSDSFTYRASDGSGTSGPATVSITVSAPKYTFVNVQNAPPPDGKNVFKTGSSIPVKWQYKLGSTVVNTSLVAQEVTVCLVSQTGQCQLLATYRNTDSGGSGFRYTSNTWYFSLQTKDSSGRAYSPGTYRVTIRSMAAGYEMRSFEIVLVK